MPLGFLCSRDLSKKFKSPAAAYRSTAVIMIGQSECRPGPKIRTPSPTEVNVTSGSGFRSTGPRACRIGLFDNAPAAGPPALRVILPHGNHGIMIMIAPHELLEENDLPVQYRVGAT